MKSNTKNVHDLCGRDGSLVEAQEWQAKTHINPDTKCGASRSGDIGSDIEKMLQHN